jgi:hypothetical protein
MQVAIQPTPAAPEVVLNPATLKIQQQPQLAVHSQSMLYKAAPSTNERNAALKDVIVSQHEQQPDGATAVGAIQTTEATGITGQKRTREEVEDNGQGHEAELKFGVPAPTVIPQCDGAGEGDEGKGDGDDLLNEEDDLADADDHEEVDEDAIKNVILGQFDKVHRTKAKWRINLKNCVATINGTDYLLKKITGEMNFA